MRTFTLKAVATGVTVLATVVSALFVGAHVKNPNAPLHPYVVGRSATQAAGGSLSLGPSVRSSDAQPVTSTYAS
jgi:hypothetical protein